MTPKKSTVEKIFDIIDCLNTSEDERSIVRKNLYEYVDLISHWQETHNLISQNLSSDDIWENVYDSIVAFREFLLIDAGVDNANHKIIDAGSGGGFPGVPISIVFEISAIALVDSDRKKCSFLRVVKSKLNLVNISVENKNIESFSDVSLIITKAAFSPKNIAVLAGTLRRGGKLLIWATKTTEEQFASALNQCNMQHVRSLEYQLPSGKERVLLVFEKI